MTKHRAFTFTLNNYTPEEVEAIKALNYLYLIIGNEIGESGTPHLQGYLYFKNAISFDTVQRAIPRGHIEPAKGNAQQNKAYCSKESTLFEDGDIPAQGKRSDIDNVRAIVAETGQIRQVVLEAQSFQSIKVAEKILEYHERKRNFRPKVYWYYGPTGTGKSHAAKNHPCVDDPYYAGKTIQWWQGYDAHETVIIDDFRANFCTYSELLKMLDRNAYSIECKGGSRQLLATRIFITSPMHPKDLYPTHEDKEQLLRRIYKIKEFTTRYIPPEEEFSDSEDEGTD